MTEIVIREPVVGDADALQKFMAAHVAEDAVNAAMRVPSSVEQERAFIARAAAAERDFALIACDGARVISMLDLTSGERGRGQHVAMFGMAVAKDWRCRGLGQRMLDIAIAKAKALPDVGRIELEVQHDNHAAIQLYKKSGFIVEARDVKRINVFGASENCLTMALTWTLAR